MKSNLFLPSPGAGSTFNLVNAQRLVIASRFAYDQSIPATEYPAATQHIAGVEEDVHVLVIPYDDCTVVSFRGTDSLRDWIEDADFRLTHTPDGRVHAGFLRGVDCIMVSLINLLLPSPDSRKYLKPLVFTGHSLGGALAVLTAFLLAKQGWPVAQVYTFGQPRVGDARFAMCYSLLLGDRTFRVVNQNDIVPWLPGWLLKYRHAGQLAFINPSGRLVINPSLTSLVISDALGLYAAYRKLDDVLVTEHFISAYERSVDNLEIN